MRQCDEVLRSTAHGYDAYARTLVASRLVMDVVDSTESVFDRHHVIDLAGRYHNFMGFMEATFNGSMNTELDPATRDWVQCLQSMTCRRRSFSTKGGRIGLGSSDAQAGDLLVVIFYCPTPYLLRQAADPEKKRFVGETYVHGLMYGEALKQFDDGLVKETKWIIE